MISKISHPSFKSVYVQQSMFDNLSPENKQKIKIAVECLDYMYHYTNDIAIFNNPKGKLCYHIQKAHPMAMLLHPEALQFFEDEEKVFQQVNLAISMTNLYNNIHGIKIPILKNKIEDIDNKTLEEVGLQMLQDVEKFNEENPQIDYSA